MIDIYKTMVQTAVSPIKEMKVDKLTVKIFSNREEMGFAAANEVAQRLRLLNKIKEEIHMIFAAAPSQNELLEELSENRNLDFSKVTAFHMDEYIGLPEDAPQRFGNFLKDRIFGKANFKEANYISPDENDVDECRRYASLIKNTSIDIVCLGIGENGHIAFNEPPSADFNDTEAARIIELDLKSRIQQVNDKCFDTLEDVPEKAITLTIPSLLKGGYLCCVVPGFAKAGAVWKTLNEQVSSHCPATYLRTHNNAELFLDRDSAKFVL